MFTAAIESAVHALYPAVEQHFSTVKTRRLSNSQLWLEMASCVLSSQVRFEVARAALAILRAERLLPIKPDVPRRKITQHIAASLSKPIFIEGTWRRYRFPTRRAEQLVEGAHNVWGEGITLTRLSYNDSDPREKREKLIELLPGIGPKQSSMFLRNVGGSHELAILDTHVLRFMRSMRLVEETTAVPTSLRRYEVLEARLRNYAENSGYKIGLLDAAIWTVMRVASREFSL